MMMLDSASKAKRILPRDMIPEECDGDFDEVDDDRF